MSGALRLASSRSPLRIRHAVTHPTSPLRIRHAVTHPTSPLRLRVPGAGPTLTHAYGSEANLHGNPKDAHFVPQEPGKDGTVSPTPPLTPRESGSGRGVAIGFAALALLGAGAYVVYEKGEEAGAKGPPELPPPAAEIPSPPPETALAEDEDAVDQEPAVDAGTALVDPSTEPSALIDAGIAAGVADADEPPPEKEPEAPAAPEPPPVAPEPTQPSVSPEPEDPLTQIPALILEGAGFADKERAWFAKEQARLRGWDGKAFAKNRDVLFKDIDAGKEALWMAKQGASTNGWPSK